LLDRRPIAERDRIGEIPRRERAKHGKRHLRADTLHSLQRAEPAPLDLAREAEKTDRVLAHVRVDDERNRLSDLHGAQCPRRGLHLVANAVDVDDAVAFADGVHEPLELADHFAASRSARAALATGLERWLA